MRILLVTPYNRTYVIMPSLGLGYLASIARKAGHEVSILHCIKERIRPDDFGDIIKRDFYDIVGFQVFSYDLYNVKRYLEVIKKLSPRTITIAGGAHPSGDPLHTMQYLDKLDFAFVGEAEIGFSKFLELVMSNKKDYPTIPGLVFRKDGTVSVNPPEYVDDLDSLPMPAWDIIKPETYPEAPHGAFTRQFPTAPIIITRGCPFTCTFCAGKSITGLKMRARSVDNVIDELKYLKKRGIREFHIEDENFTARKRLVMDFCERLLRERLCMSWSLPAGVRIDTITREVLVLMEKAGCYSMALGIEFGSQRMMDVTKKRLSLELIREKLGLFNGLNIKKTGFFLFGIPGESIEEMEETVRFALSLPIERAQFNNFMPLPGSELWELLKKAGKLEDIDWRKFFVHDVAYTDPGITPKDLKRIQRMAYIRFYMRPKVIMKVLKEIRSLRHLKFLMRRFFDALR